MLDVIDLPLSTRSAHEKETRCASEGINLSMYEATELFMNSTLACSLVLVVEHGRPT